MNYCARIRNEIGYFESEVEAVNHVYESLNIGRDQDFLLRKQAVVNLNDPEIEISQITAAEDIEMLGRILMGGGMQELNLSFDEDGNLNTIQGD